MNIARRKTNIEKPVVKSIFDDTEKEHLWISLKLKVKKNIFHSFSENWKWREKNCVFFTLRLDKKWNGEQVRTGGCGADTEKLYIFIATNSFITPFVHRIIKFGWKPKKLTQTYIQEQTTLQLCSCSKRIDLIKCLYTFCKRVCSAFFFILFHLCIKYISDIRSNRSHDEMCVGARIQ